MHIAAQQPDPSKQRPLTQDLTGASFAGCQVPDVDRQGWREVAPGAAVAVVVWLVASGGFAVYVASFGSYNKSWGTLSAVVITLVWLWLTSAALLFGAEVNAETRSLRSEGREVAAPHARRSR